MLRKINLQGAESDAGFRVQIVSRGELEYSVGRRRLLVGFEPGVSPDGLPDIAVYLSRVTAWEPPYDREAIDASRRVSIAGQISEALSFLGIDHQII